MDDIEELFKDFEWPKYSPDGKLVELTHTDKSGVRWILWTGSENFHNAMVEAAKNYKSDGQQQ